MARGSKGSAATSTRSRSAGSAKASAERSLTFDDVVKLGLTLPDTEESMAYGGRCLKINGRFFTAIGINKSAEPNSLIIQVDTAQRDLMIEEQPELYYTAAHYANYACVLVRMSRLDRGLLGDLLRMSHRFVTEKYKDKPKPRPRTRHRRPEGKRKRR